MDIVTLFDLQVSCPAFLLPPGTETIFPLLPPFITHKITLTRAPPLSISFSHPSFHSRFCRFSSPVYFPILVIHSPSISLYLSISINPVISMIPALSEGDTHTLMTCMCKDIPAMTLSWLYFIFLSGEREGCQHQACKDEFYLILHDAMSGTVSMQTINLAIMTQRHTCTRAAWTHKYIAASTTCIAHTQKCMHARSHTHSEKHMQPHAKALAHAHARVTEIHTCTVLFSPSVEACSVMVVWNLLPPAEIKRITPASCHTSRGSKGNKNWLNLVWK